MVLRQVCGGFGKSLVMYVKYVVGCEDFQIAKVCSLIILNQDRSRSFLSGA